MFNPSIANWLGSLVSWLCDGYWPDRQDESWDSIQGPDRVYAIQQLRAVGDVADIYLATSERDSTSELYGRYLLKISRVPEGRALLNNERKTLTKLLIAAGDTTYRKYIPGLVGSFAATGVFPRRINVFLAERGFHNLEQVHEQHSAWTAGISPGTSSAS